MRKALASALLLLFVSGAAATTIDSESLVIDIENSTARAEVEVNDLTSPEFTYITSADISSVRARIDGEEADCSVETLSIGSEVQCETDLRENFTANIFYEYDGLLETDGELSSFRYSHPIYRPTKRFNLRVILPPGTGLVQQNESSFQPATGSIGSNGRTIFVNWEEQPQIGDTLSYEINYENYNNGNGIGVREIVAVVLATVLFLGGLVYWWRRRNIENLSSVYSELTEDESQVLELLRENEGEMLQKDVVSSTDYSKAKISGVVSELVEKGIVEKEKEGRSNKLKIAKGYSY